MLGKKLITTGGGGLPTGTDAITSFGGHADRNVSLAVQTGPFWVPIGAFGYPGQIAYYRSGSYYVRLEYPNYSSSGMSWDETTDGRYATRYAKSFGGQGVVPEGTGELVYRGDGNAINDGATFTGSGLYGPSTTYNTFRFTADGNYFYVADGTYIRQFTLATANTFDASATYVDLEIEQLQEDNNFFDFYGNGQYVAVHKSTTEGSGNVHFYKLATAYDLSSGLTEDNGSFYYSAITDDRFTISEYSGAARLWTTAYQTIRSIAINP